MKCPLCDRIDPPMEKHHLETRRKSEAIEKICRECHKTIHGLFSNSELRDERLALNSVEGLLADLRFNKALKFIKRVPPGGFMKMRDSK